MAYPRCQPGDSQRTAYVALIVGVVCTGIVILQTWSLLHSLPRGTVMQLGGMGLFHLLLALIAVWFGGIVSASGVLHSIRTRNLPGVLVFLLALILCLAPVPTSLTFARFLVLSRGLVLQ